MTPQERANAREDRDPEYRAQRGDPATVRGLEPPTLHPNRGKVRAADSHLAIGCPLCATLWDCADCTAAHLTLRHRTTWERATHPVYPHPYSAAFCDPAGCEGVPA